jgi:hypothetical protein
MVVLALVLFWRKKRRSKFVGKKSSGSRRPQRQRLCAKVCSLVLVFVFVFENDKVKVVALKGWAKANTTTIKGSSFIL